MKASALCGRLFHFWLIICGLVPSSPLRHLPGCRPTSSLRGTVPGSLWTLRPNCLRRRTVRTVSFPHDAASRLPRDAAAGLPSMAPPKSHPAHGAVRKPSQGLENKKSVRIATFLRLGIVVWPQIASRGVKTRITGHKAAYFRFTGAEGSS